jgi:hypothetical protein
VEVRPPQRAEVVQRVVVVAVQAACLVDLRALSRVWLIRLRYFRQALTAVPATVPYATGADMGFNVANASATGADMGINVANASATGADMGFNVANAPGAGFELPVGGNEFMYDAGGEFIPVSIS